MSKYSADYYAKRRDAFLAYAKKSYKKIKDAQKALKDVPCADCGGVFPHYVMEFDHRPDTDKVKAVSSCYTMPQLLKEAAKCDVVCANCHTIRTYQRRQIEE